MLDFATLTGACVVALGPHIAGVMSNDDALAAAFLAAAARAGEEMWRLPLPPRLGEQLKSEIADLKNTGERWGGALTAGLFLKEFVGDVALGPRRHRGPVEREQGIGPRRAKAVPASRSRQFSDYLRRSRGLSARNRRAFHAAAAPIRSLKGGSNRTLIQRYCA